MRITKTCGKIMMKSYEFGDKKLWILSENGSFMTPYGAIVLSAADAALMEAGLLHPYGLVIDILPISNSDGEAE